MSTIRGAGSMSGWFRPLDAQRRRNKTGLTIPFLLGALRDPPGPIPEEDAAYRDLLTLLVEIRESNLESHVVRLSRCTEHREPIAALHPRSDSQRANTAIPSSRGDVSLFVDHRYGGGTGTIDPVLAFLWKEYREQLASGHYSLRDGSYQEFSEGDRDFIKKALAVT